MVVLELYVNGVHQYTAGVGEQGSLSAHTSWAHMETGIENLPMDMSKVQIIGVHPRGEIVGWPHIPLKVGDEVTIKLAEGSQFDPAETSQPFDVDGGSIDVSPNS